MKHYVIRLVRKAGARISGDGYIGVGGVFVKHKASAKRWNESEVYDAINRALLDPKFDNFEPTKEDE